MKSIRVRTSGFETDHEITAKLVRRGCRIVEEPIEYLPRSFERERRSKRAMALWPYGRS